MNFLYTYLPQLSGDSGLDTVLYLIILAAIGGIAYAIYWNVEYKTVYSDLKKDHGIVDDMNYEAPTSTYNYATKTTTRTSEKNVVIIKFNRMGTKRYDSSKLYQRVRIDDKVTAEYQEVYRVERKNPDHKILTGYETKSVTSPTGRTVDFT